MFVRTSVGGWQLFSEKKCEIRKKLQLHQSNVRTIKKFLTIKVSINMEKS